MLQATRELVALLPYRMRERARGYIDFVDDVLYEILVEQGLEDRIADFQDTVETIFCVKLIYSYINVGYSNYSTTLRFLQDRGAGGFEVGSNSYGTQTLIDNEWQELRRELDTIINQVTYAQVNVQADSQEQLPIRRYVISDASVRSIIEDIVQQLRQ